MTLNEMVVAPVTRSVSATAVRIAISVLSLLICAWLILWVEAPGWNSFQLATVRILTMCAVSTVNLLLWRRWLPLSPG